MMKFWEGNKADQEFEMSEEQVAKLFWSAMRRARHGSQAFHEDQVLKLDNWPLERTLRDWMTRTDGLNASWDDDFGFELILRAAGDLRRNERCADHQMNGPEHDACRR